jgi:3-oxoacyl-[acyl-carrier protein] reductase
MQDFSNKVIVVTGGARGIGLAIATAFAAQKARLVLCDVNEEDLENAKAVIEKQNTEALPIKVDVSDFASVQSAVETIKKQYGRIDVLVNNAGITRDNFLLRMSEDDFDSVIRVNLRGTFAFTKAVAKLMMKQKSGAIVNIASVVGLTGNIGQCNYSASKAGVIGITKSAAKELAKRNIRVNAVAPGFIKTKMTDALPEKIKNDIMSTIPFARFGTPQEVADVVLFLAGEASGYMTGQVLTVSGGMVM